MQHSNNKKETNKYHYQLTLEISKKKTEHWKNNSLVKKLNQNSWLETSVVLMEHWRKSFE